MSAGSSDHGPYVAGGPRAYEKAMGESTKAKYATEDGEEAKDTAVKTAAIARQCVRQMKNHAIFSAPWFELTESLEQLARLAQLEAMMPNDKKVAEMKGRVDTAGTLWDQDGHEDAIRILVEEAKVNLCLRMMNEYKKLQYDSGGTKMSAALKEAMQQQDLTEAQLGRMMSTFEEALGLLLLRCFMHVEALQLTDVPLVIEHCQMVLENTQDGSGRGWGAKSQETLVLYYFASIMKHSEELNSQEVMQRTREANLVPLVVEQVFLIVDALSDSRFPREVLGVVAQGLKSLADNEDFQPIWEDFLPTPELKQRFLELDAGVVQPLIQDEPSKRAELRPLLDLFNKVKRKAGR